MHGQPVSDPTIGTHPRFLASEFAARPAADARFHVVPVPLEQTVSYGAGTASGPEAIIRASDQLEVWDGYSCPGEEGIATWPQLDCGDTIEEAHERIFQSVGDVMSVGEHVVPFLLGGEHSLTYPAARAVHKKLGSPIGVVQFDAHADLRDSYEGSALSHASVARRIHQEERLPLAQYGVRSLSPEEVIYRELHSQDLATCDAAHLVGQPPLAPELPEWMPEAIYLTVDVDVLDVATMPATGTPVPGGLDWYRLLALIEGVAASRRIVAVDIVELAPIAGFHGFNYLVAELAYRIMGFIARAGVVR